MKPTEYWYRRYPARFARATLSMSLAERGAYSILIDWIMEHGEAPPDDDAALARIVGCELAEWQSVAPAVRAKFTPRKGRLVQPFASHALKVQNSSASKRSIAASNAAKARWLKEKENDAPRMQHVSGENARGEERRGEENKNIKPNGSSSFAARARGPTRARAFTAEDKKAAWFTKITAEINRTMLPEEAQTLIAGYLENEPTAKRRFEEIDRGIRARKSG